MQNAGTLADTDLASLLTTVQTERATGSLAIEGRSGSASLYFLFGILLHARGDRGEGEDVVLDALTWSDGSYRFDARAKVPFEENIRASTADLVAEGLRRRGDVAVAGSEAEAETAAVPEPALVAQAAGGGAVADAPREMPAPAEVAAELGPEPATEAWITDDASTAAPAAEPELAAEEREREIETVGAASTSLPASARPSWNRRTGDAPPLADVYPLPAGVTVYEHLKSAIVYFPKLIATLRSDRHTGYLRLDGDGFQGLLLLHDGHLLEALYKESELRRGEDAFLAVRRRMEAGDGSCDLVRLPGETVVAVAQLLMARPLYTGLRGRFVDFPQLLEHLGEERVDGSVVVAGGGDTGVILLRRGQILGAYTNSRREVVQDTAQVAALAADRDARIEVKAGLGEVAGIDVEQALAGA